MRSLTRVRRWLRWAMLLPLMGVYAEGSCSVGEAMREIADGINDAADTIDGDDNDLNRFIDDMQELFD